MTKPEQFKQSTQLFIHSITGYFWNNIAVLRLFENNNIKVLLETVRKVGQLREANCGKSQCKLLSCFLYLQNVLCLQAIFLQESFKIIMQSQHYCSCYQKFSGQHFIESAGSKYYEYHLYAIFDIHYVWVNFLFVLIHKGVLHGLEYS